MEQNKFVSPNDLGMPFLTEKQLKEASRIASENAAKQNLSQADIDSIIAKEILIRK